MKKLLVVVAASGLFFAVSANAKVSADKAAELGKSLTPLGAEQAANKEGTIPAWTGGYKLDRPAEGKERLPSSYPEINNDKPEFIITAANLNQYKDKLTPGAIALFKKFPKTYKMPVYKTRRTSWTPEFVDEATKKNALTAELGAGGESLLNAAIGIPFPIPGSGKEIMWNHKTRYRGQSVRRYNTQLAVQTSGAFVPYKLREDVRFHYNLPGMTADAINNVIIYFLQFTTAPQRQAGSVLLVHETMDQVKEKRRAWLYNPGQRRIRRAPNVAYDNPGTGSDGLRTNDQLDVFNGATDRYTWKITGKKELYLPYNAVKLIDSNLKYSDIAKPGHINQDLTRYELRRVWVLESDLVEGTSHIYKRRTFYVDEDTWSAIAVDVYDRRDQLWRVQESHSVAGVWMGYTAPVASTVYDLQSGRYLALDLGNEEPMFEQTMFDLGHYTTRAVTLMATK